MKRYTWAFPFCSGIIAIIGVLTPVAFYESFYNFWLWGLIYTRLPDSKFEFMTENVFFITGLIISIIITVFALVLIITGYIYRQGYYSDKDLGKLWAICGVLILISIIVSLVSLDYYTYEDFFPLGIWAYLNPGFGAIGPILGSITAIGTGVFVSVSEKEVRLKKKSRLITAMAPKNLCPHCGKPISLNASFCSKCGKTIADGNGL
jgi:hypothetical protein